MKLYQSENKFIKKVWQWYAFNQNKIIKKIRLWFFVRKERNWYAIKVKKNIKRKVLKEFNKRKYQDKEAKRITGHDYHNRLGIAQLLEKLKLEIYPFFKECPYCKKKYELEQISFRGDEFHCIRTQDCKDKWDKDTFSPERLKWFEQFEGAKSASFTLGSNGEVKSYHITKEEELNYE